MIFASPSRPQASSVAGRDQGIISSARGAQDTSPLQLFSGNGLRLFHSTLISRSLPAAGSRCWGRRSRDAEACGERNALRARVSQVGATGRMRSAKKPETKASTLR